MSEFGHILELTSITRLWFCAWGKDPNHQPISSRDFATGVAAFAAKDNSSPELLLGGPQVLTWSELSVLISEALGKQIIVISLAIIFYKVWVGVVGLTKSLLPFLEGFENVLKISTIPMISNCTNDEFECVGMDHADAHLRAQAAAGRATYVKERIVLPWHKTAKTKKD